MPKGKKKVEVVEAVVSRNVSAIQVGNDIYQIAPVSNGRGVDLRNSNGQIFVPMGKAGQTIARELLNLTREVEVAPKKKRTRRTKAELEASKLPEAN